MKQSSTQTILHIDDDMGCLKLVSLILQMNGYSVLTETNGRNGFKIAVREHPDLILLDLNLPDMNGEQMITSLRANAGTRHIPVIIFTALSERPPFTTGYDHYLTKPKHPKELIIHVRDMLNTTQQSRK